MYKIVFKESVSKDFDILPKERKKIIWNKIRTALSANPYKNKLLKGKWADLRRYETHPYRVIYDIFEQEKTVLILRVRYRKEIYR